MNKRIFTVIVCALLGLFARGHAQVEVKNLSLGDVIRLAKEQSLEAFIARNRFIGSYWKFRTFQADYLPTLNVNATLADLNRSISKITLPDGRESFVSQKVLSNYGGLSIRQNIGPVGGVLSVNSELERIDWLDRNDQVKSYHTVPVSIGYSQPLFGFNAYKWDREIEPLGYEEAKRSYLSDMELVAQRAVDKYFDDLLAQINLSMAQSNLINSDSIYKIAQGRYNIGTIARNELLQAELSFLNAKSALNEARLNQELSQAKLRSFLGYNKGVVLKLELSQDMPVFDVDVEKALMFAMENSHHIAGLKLQELAAERDVAQARAENRLQVDLNASFGLTQSADNIGAAYRDPQDTERFRLGIGVPVLDWGKGRGRYRMAQSNREVVRVSVKQALIDFEQEVYLQVMRFNMQDEQVEIAVKADKIAQSRYDVTKSRYFIGKVGLLDLNVALTEKDLARRTYVEALRMYWRYFYVVRQLTLYDFIQGSPLDQNFDRLLN